MIRARYRKEEEAAESKDTIKTEGESTEVALAGFLDDLDVVANDDNNRQMKKQQSYDMLSSSDDDVRDGNGETADDVPFLCTTIESSSHSLLRNGFCVYREEGFIQTQTELLENVHHHCTNYLNDLLERCKTHHGIKCERDIFRFKEICSRAMNGKRFDFQATKLSDVNTKNIVFGDSGSASDDRLTFGAGTDLSIYHDGSHSRIVDSGTGNLIVQTSKININNADGSQAIIHGTAGGSVEIYHANTNVVTTSANGLAFPNGKGIDFSATGDGSGTDSSELLDDYEEGSWIPDVRGSSSPGSATYTSRTGHYVKVGRLVMLWSDVRWSAHNGSGGLEVYGLPYSVQNSGYTSHFGINYNSGHSYSTTHYGWANNGGNYIRYWETNTSGGTGSLALDSVVSEIHFYGQYMTS